MVKSRVGRNSWFTGGHSGGCGGGWVAGGWWGWGGSLLAYVMLESLLGMMYDRHDIIMFIKR